MSNWLLLTTRGDKYRRLVRLDAVQFVREGYDHRAGIAFEGVDGFVGVEESFDDVYKAIDSLWREGESIIKVAEDGGNDADSGESV